MDVELTSLHSSAVQLRAAPTTLRKRRLRAPLDEESGPASDKAVSGIETQTETGAGPSLRDRLRAVLSPPIDCLLPAQGSLLDWAGELLPFQLDGVRVLVARPEVLLADDMGLGKTIQTIAALRILFHERALEAALVVAPASLVYQWRGELKRWAPELRVSTVRGPAQERALAWTFPAHIFLTTYETLRADHTANRHCGPRRRTWGVVVLDEAQRIKNRDTAGSVACKTLPRSRSWALTGTPLENSIDDLASIMEFLQPNEGGERVAALPVDAQLLARHGELQLRRRKADVLTELPPKRTHGVVLDLSAAQRAAYERAERAGIVELRARGETITITHILSLITHLKQICNFCPQTGESAKLADLTERLGTLRAEGHRALVFAQFTDGAFGVHAIARGLSRFAPLVYTGAMSQEERHRTVGRFKEDPSHGALVLSLRAGGQGLNLQEASYVVHFDRWWNPASEQQAEGRSHRMGQLTPVDVYTYTCSGTIEERIADLLEAKQQLFDTVIDQVSMDLDRVLSAEELFGLFGLTPPTKAARDRLTSAPGERGAPPPGDRLAPAPQDRAAPAPEYAAMSGRELAELVERLFRNLGYETERGTESLREARDDGVAAGAAGAGGRGVDIIARRDDVVGVTTTLHIQCANHAAPLGADVVRAIAGVVPAGDPGGRSMVVCPAGFSAAAASCAEQRDVQLVDGARLAELLARTAAPGERP